MTRREFIKALMPWNWFKTEPEPVLHYGEVDEENQTVEIYFTKDGERTGNTVKIHYISSERADELRKIKL